LSDADAMETLMRYVSDTGYADLPSNVVDSTKRVVLDLMGVIAAGSSTPEAHAIRSLVRGWGGRGESSILVHGERIPAPNAGLVNSTMGRARDFDDVHEKAVLHPSVSVIPAALAASELRGGVDGREFISAVALGVDLTCRLGMAPRTGPNISGMSTTWQCGTFGAAAASGKVMGLDHEELMDAMGIAYSQASGNQQAIAEGSKTVRVQQGLTTWAGIVSALLASSGITGPRNVLEGKYGYYPVYHSDGYDVEALTEGLGETYEIVNTSIKPYPCCKWTHQAIDATLKAVREESIEPGKVESVNVRLNRQAYNLVCVPLDKKRRPRTTVDAQFSIPYTVAAALVRGDVSLDTFTAEMINDPEILRMAQKVTSGVDEQIEKQGARGIAPEIVEIRTTGGGTYRRCVEHVRGSPAAPMTAEELHDKFVQCIAYAAKPIPDEVAEELYTVIGRLEHLDDISEMIALLS
jgi:2-methylcitrate dehydratase PrpD